MHFFYCVHFHTRQHCQGAATRCLLDGADIGAGIMVGDGDPIQTGSERLAHD